MDESRDMELIIHDNRGDVPYTLDNSPKKHPNLEFVRDKNGKSLARKSVSLSGVDPELIETVKSEFMKELNTLRQARYYHVVECFDAYMLRYPEDEAYLAFTMERANNSLKSYFFFPEFPRLYRGWLGCLTDAVAYIHRKGIRHRDIKPDNILVSKQGQRMLLADFGISKMGIGKTLSTTIPAFARARTVDFCAPEVEDGQSRGRSADIFSLGAVFLEMLVAGEDFDDFHGLQQVLTCHGKTPHSYASNLKDIHKWIDSFNERHTLDQQSSEILALCRKMLSREETSRPEALQVWQIFDRLKFSHQCGCHKLKSSPEFQLLLACHEGHFTTVQSLLTNGSLRPPTEAIHLACSKGHRTIVEVLLDHIPCNIQDGGGQTSLHIAASYGHLDLCSILLQRDANASMTDQEGDTALHHAAGYGSVAIVQLLLQRDVSIHATNFEGQTALHSAARRGHTEVIRLLISQGLEVNKLDRQKRTALHLAAGYGSKDAVEVLFEQGACPQGCDEAKGWNELHFAASGKRLDGDYLEVIRLLLAKGSDVLAESHTKHLAFQLAEKGSKVEKVLRKEWYKANELLNDWEDIFTPLEEVVGSTRHFTAKHLAEITESLERVRPGWARAARVFAIFCTIGVPKYSIPKLMDQICQRVTDRQLPLPEKYLQGVFSSILSPGYLARLRKAQIKVLDEQLILDRHCNIMDETWQKALEGLQELGSGGFAKVLKVKLKLNSEHWALKLIERNTETPESISQELEILRRVRHQHIVEYVGSFTSLSHIGLLMRPVASYNLATYLSNATDSNGFKIPLSSFFGCLSNALDYLHNEKHICHNDIKPANILVDDGRVMFTDFGVSLDWSDTLRSTRLGQAAKTLMYCAPEVAQHGQQIRSSADVWSLGCVFLEILTVLRGYSLEDLKKRLANDTSRNSCFSENLPALRVWMDELEPIPSTSGSVPVLWIKEMLQLLPSARPQARALLQLMQQTDCERNSSDSMRFFGNCCGSEIRSNQRIPLKSVPIDHYSIAESSKIAAATLPGEDRVYFQCTNGEIRQSIRKHSDLAWSGRYMSNELIGQGRMHTAIAAIAWEQGQRLRQPEIRVYFLDQSDYLQERRWNPYSGWEDGPLREGGFRASSHSQLTATCLDDGYITLWFESRNGTFQMLHKMTNKERWVEGIQLDNILSGSSLSAISFPNAKNHAIRLFSRVRIAHIREACWHSVTRNSMLSEPWAGKFKNPTYHDIGDRVRSLTARDPIAAVLTRVDQTSQEVEFRCYAWGLNGFEEWICGYDFFWRKGRSSVGSDYGAGYIAVLPGTDTAVNIYQTSNGKLHLIH